ncbi:hypothetical protein GCM10010345_92840 [Streptomyces canarius]|uniref:Uncharacterized protein n=1 Tax=Streptomyces canarius TaxID=285453 RepID=A0ABQ3DD37_9ACTN|nr:hypothetical protein GCM10010345_92840 [Streptomyces canarius]
MVDVQTAGPLDEAVVVRGEPRSPAQPAVRALLRSDDRLGLEDLGAGVAAVLVGVDPVLELRALIPGAVLSADRKLGEGVLDGQSDGIPRRGGVRGGVRGRRGEE